MQTGGTRAITRSQHVRVEEEDELYRKLGKLFVKEMGIVARKSHPTHACKLVVSLPSGADFTVTIAYMEPERDQ